MRDKFYPLALVILGGLILVACNSNDTKPKTQATPVAPGTSSVYADGARRVTIAELEMMLKNNQAVVIDVRNQAAFDDGHIPGSKLIPAGEILAHVSELPTDKLIVTYCS